MIDCRVTDTREITLANQKKMENTLTTKTTTATLFVPLRAKENSKFSKTSNLPEAQENAGKLSRDWFQSNLTGLESGELFSVT